jgi:uncharacterized metal-binding protein
MADSQKVVIIPCSGIGKSYGTVSRFAAYQVTEDDCPEDTHLVPLALLVMGDEEARAWLASCPSIAIDGCKLACATKMVSQCGGTLAQSFDVLDAFRRHREFKPQGIAELNEGGIKLSAALAEEVEGVVSQLTRKEVANA